MATLPLVTLAQAKGHLRLTTPDGHPSDADLQLKVDAAVEFVRRYVGRSAFGLSVVDAWLDATTTPPDAQAAILILLGSYWRFRGDDLDGATPAVDIQDAPPVVVSLLRRFCDPVQA
jgi:hypothetical protein